MFPKLQIIEKIEQEKKRKLLTQIVAWKFGNSVEAYEQLTTLWPRLAFQPLGTLFDLYAAHSVMLAFPNMIAPALLSFLTTQHPEIQLILEVHKIQLLY